jgi:hypothetical protein
MLAPTTRQNVGGKIMNINEQKPVKAPGIIWRPEAEKTFIVYNQATDWLHRTHEIGIEVLKLCDGNHTVSEIVNAITEKHTSSETPDEIESSVISYLNQLNERKIIIWR